MKPSDICHPFDITLPQGAPDLMKPDETLAQTTRYVARGLTKREHFAGLALQGLLANSGGPIQANSLNGWGLANGTAEDVARVAVAAADALILELAK